MTATLHEKVCALMRDGQPRMIVDVCSAVGSPYHVIYRIMAKLETEDSLSTVRDPSTGGYVYSWVP